MRTPNRFTAQIAFYLCFALIALISVNVARSWAENTISAQLSSKPLSSQQVPLGLPPLPIDTHSSEAMRSLGEKIFFDRRLSFNNTNSCGMCHIPSQAFASTQGSTAVGMEGLSLRRNAPTLLNVVYQKTLFHDGRETSLSRQVWLPMLAHDEMANPSIGIVIDRIKSFTDYDGLFEKAFDGRGPSMETVGDAVAAYQRTLLSGNSRFDQWYYGKKEGALNDDEKNGFRIFSGKGRCATCHLIGEKHALFTDHEFHNTGVGYLATSNLGAQSWQVELAPGVFTTVHKGTPGLQLEPPNDVGRFEITLNSDDRWAYKTPSLRNVAATFPYMHNGFLFSLEEVVDYYDRGGVPHEAQSQLITPLNLSSKEKQDLVAFLKSLNGDNIGAGYRNELKKAQMSSASKKTSEQKPGQKKDQNKRQ